MLVRFFVPQHGTEGEDGSKVADEVAAWLTDLYGGATLYTVDGADRHTPLEPITVVEAYTDTYNGADLTRIARHVKSALSQETAAYAVERDAELTWI